MPNFRAGLFSQSSNRILNGRFGFFSRSESGRRSPDRPSLATETCKTIWKPTGAHRVAKRAVDHGHGVTRSRRKRPRRRCRPTSLLGRSDRPLALLLSSLFFCSETLLSRFLVASQPVRDLLLCAKHLFVAARTMGCSHHQTSATSSGSVSLAIA